MQFEIIAAVDQDDAVICDNMEFMQLVESAFDSANTVLISDTRTYQRDGRISIIISECDNITYHRDADTLTVSANSLHQALDWCLMSCVSRVYCVGTTELYSVALLHPLCACVSILRTQNAAVADQHARTGDAVAAAATFPFHLMHNDTYSTTYSRIGSAMLERYQYVNTDEAG